MNTDTAPTTPAAEAFNAAQAELQAAQDALAAAQSRAAAAAEEHAAAGAALDAADPDGEDFAALVAKKATALARRDALAARVPAFEAAYRDALPAVKAARADLLVEQIEEARRRAVAKDRSITAKAAAALTDLGHEVEALTAMQAEGAMLLKALAEARGEDARHLAALAWLDVLAWGQSSVAGSLSNLAHSVNVASALQAVK